MGLLTLFLTPIKTSANYGELTFSMVMVDKEEKQLCKTWEHFTHTSALNSLRMGI